MVVVLLLVGGWEGCDILWEGNKEWAAVAVVVVVCLFVFVTVPLHSATAVC